MTQCKNCGSFAINPGHHGRREGVDLDLCDVCYWRSRLERIEKAAKDVLSSLAGSYKQQRFTVSRTSIDALKRAVGEE